jgi:hypothetical protein
VGDWNDLMKQLLEEVKKPEKTDTSEDGTTST